MKQESKLLPTDWIVDSIETYIYQQRPRKRIIYMIVLVAIMSTIISLPFIYVDITVQSRGIIRPSGEVSRITAPMTEIVETIHAKEGDVLRQGDEILRFRTGTSDGKISYQRNRLEDLRAQITDLTHLVKGVPPTMFSSTVRQQEYSKYQQEIHRLQTELCQYEEERKRNNVLFDKKLISENEYNLYYYKFLDKQNELNSLKASQLSIWQTELTRLRTQQDEIVSNLTEINNTKTLHIVKSPINGTLEQFTGIYPGSNVQAGTTVAVVSPNTALYIEAYVAPRDIAFITEGMPIKVQIESFNYNEWGTLDGTVKSISSDCINDNNGRIYYKVKCTLNRNYFELGKNNRRGIIKKGMTGIVHFVVTRQSLFALLYKSIDDWMNPTQHQSPNIVSYHLSQHINGNV